jgi:diacylglycerol kinase family enzyme
MRVAVISNPRAGADDDPSPERIRAALKSAGMECEMCPAKGRDLNQAIEDAMALRPDAIVASGGDGTVSAVAGRLVNEEIALAVLPTGTLNHFAKDLGMPMDLEGAARVIAAGNVRRIDVGEVNGQRFINNASIGLYPHIVRKRDEIRERLGHGKFVAMFFAMMAVFKRYPAVSVRINLPEVAFERKTPFVFVGNNRYDVALNSVKRRQALDRHELCVYFTNRTGRFALLRLALRGILGRMDQEKDFMVVAVPALQIDTRRQLISIALDGEVRRMKPPLEFRTLAGTLRVVGPGVDAGDSFARETLG